MRFGEDNEIVIPMAIWNELRTYNKVPEKRRIVKEILGYFESLDSEKLFSEGVVQENGSILRVARIPEKKYSTIVESKNPSITGEDKDIFATCLEIQDKNPGMQVILISKNSWTRIVARSVGIMAEDFKADLFPPVPQQYSGRMKVYISSEDMNKFYRDGEIAKESVYEYKTISWIRNMFLEMEAYDGNNASALARFDGCKIVKLCYATSFPYGIIPKNEGQRFLLECLMRPWEEAPLVVVKGGAGTGKTYCSLAYALQRHEEDSAIRILVATPSETVGNEKLGFLPGDIGKKFTPYLGGIKDNLGNLINSEKKREDSFYEDGSYFFERGRSGRPILELQPIGFLRGRTIMNSIFIIDETQNIEPGDIKSIVTRAAEGSKFIFLGDPTQVDNPKLNERYNGLVYLSEKMKDNPLCWQVTLSSKESVRSELSTVASKLL